MASRGRPELLLQTAALLRCPTLDQFPSVVTLPVGYPLALGPAARRPWRIPFP
ncbi:MAG: hypothetical protein ACHQFZ_10960 [Acidimicrobiales bacterium]